MVSKLCCLGPLLKQQGKYYPRRNEERVIEQLERSAWQEYTVPDEAEYPYDWLKSASTTKQQNGSDRRRRFLSRKRSVHAVTDAEIAEDFTFDSVVANIDLSRKESDDVIKSVVNPELPEDKNDVALKTVKSQTVGVDDVGTEDRSVVGQHANISSVLTNTALTNEEAPLESLLEEVERQKEKESKSGKEAPSSSQKQGVDENQITSIKKFLENEQRCAEATVSSVPPAASPCSASASAKSLFPNTQKDTSCDQNASSDHQAHQQSDQGVQDGENAEEQTPSGVLVDQDNVMDHARLEEDRQEQRMRDWIRVHRPTVPRGQSLIQQNGHSSQRQNQGQRENNQSSRSGNDHVIRHLIAHRSHQPYPQFPLELPQQRRQQSHPEHRVRQLSDIEQIQRTLHQYHIQRRSRPNEAERGDRRQERQEQRPQQQRPYLAGESGAVRNDIERTRDNIVRELRQQNHRTGHREGYVSRVMAIVRQRHTLPEQNADNPPVSQSGHPPAEQERRVRPPNIQRAVPRQNPHPPRRRRRCQKHFNGAVYQPKKE